VASFDLFIWTVLIISSSPAKIHFVDDRTVFI
jgi:hypothetical protein